MGSLTIHIHMISKKIYKKVFRKIKDIKMVIVEGIFVTQILKKYSHKINLSKT